MTGRALHRWDRFWLAPALPDGLGLGRLAFFFLLFLYYVRVDFSAWGDVSDAFWMPITAFRILPHIFVLRGERTGP